jgi:hypothetical protein
VRIADRVSTSNSLISEPGSAIGAIWIRAARDLG